MTITTAWCHAIDGGICLASSTTHLWTPERILNHKTRLPQSLLRAMVHGKSKLSDEAARAASKPISILSIVQRPISQVLVRHQTNSSAKVLLASVQIQYPHSVPIPERLRRGFDLVFSVLEPNKRCTTNATSFLCFTEDGKLWWHNTNATGTLDTEPLLSYLSDLLLRDGTCATPTDNLRVDAGNVVAT